MEDNKTFTQAEMNAIIETRLAREKEKYADYESLKEKAGKFDSLEEANKSEIQKANEKAAALQKELDSLKTASKIKDIKTKVSSDTGVPVELLSGSDEETCKKQAEAILKFAKPKSYPGTKTNTSQKSQASPEDNAMREFARQIFNRGE